MNSRRLLAYGALLLAGLGLLGAAGAYAYVRWWLTPQLPSTAEIRELKLQVPLRVFSADGKLIGEFGAERRAPLKYEDVPKRVIEAFLAAEDDRFFQHPGVDWQGLARAAVHLALTGHKTQGGSTITMQLARNYFLTTERTYTRKAKEILLALRMEHELTKQQILETYLNKIYLGNRAYGVGAAAQVYFGEEPQDLTLSEIAVIAGLPKAPSRDNPVDNPARARERRDYVLHRMRDLGFISELDLQAALAEPIDARLRATPVEVDANYVAEMARAELYGRYGEDTYTGGFSVVTTINATLQQAANAALRHALLDYDRRHGYRGPEAQAPAAALADQAQSETAPETARTDLYAALDQRPDMAGLMPAVVLDSGKDRIRALTRNDGVVTLEPKDFEWANLTDKTRPRRGDIIRVTRDGERWELAQIPEVQGALVALDPHDGAIKALIGGYDFFQGRFNRATQARRQAGSGFKPFFYSAAMNAGFTPASVVLDAPVVFDDPSLESLWRPENYERDFLGPTRLREALVHSRNLVSIRLLQAIGVDYARGFAAAHFGLAEDRMPQNLSLALGSASFTPLEMARAYAVFANDGFLVDPYFIAEIRGAGGETPGGETLFKAAPAVACRECEQARLEAAAEPAPPPVAPAQSQPLAPRVLDERTVYLVADMMRDVVRRGTGARAAELGRSDIAGKTGTTNDFTDAWFNGFDEHLVAISWVGYDQPKSLGRGEVGGSLALPMWMDFMRVALKQTPQDVWPRPPGLVTVRINPDNGKLAAAGNPNAIFEVVPAEHVPPPDARAPDEQQKQQKDVQDIY